MIVCTSRSYVGNINVFVHSQAFPFHADVEASPQSQASTLQTSYTSVLLANQSKRTSGLAYMFNTAHPTPKRTKIQNVLRRVLARGSEDTCIIACTFGTTYERSTGLHRLQNTSVRFCLEHKDSAGKHMPYSNMFVWIS